MFRSFLPGGLSNVRVVCYCAWDRREAVVRWFRRFKNSFASKREFDIYIVFCMATLMLCVVVTLLLVAVIVWWM